MALPPFRWIARLAAAALGAEGVSKDIDMLVGNGYCKGHAEATLQILREDDRLRRIFVERYG